MKFGIHKRKFSLFLSRDISFLASIFKCKLGKLTDPLVRHSREIIKSNSPSVVVFQFVFDGVTLGLEVRQVAALLLLLHF